jgi:hypothetical protein
MKLQSFVAVMVASCVLAGQAGGQGAVPVPRTGSWEIVENVPRGTLVAVKSALADGSSETVHCLFHAADETQLVCGHYSRPRQYPWPTYSPANPNRYIFPREQVLEIRIENEDWQTSQSSLAGAFAGATLGGVVGYNCCGAKGGERAAGALGLSLLGGLVGGVVGHVFPLVRGHVIYRL